MFSAELIILTLVVRLTHLSFQILEANYPLISSFLASFDCQATFTDRDVNSSVNLFMNALHTSMLRFAPKVNYRKSNFPFWVSEELINLIRYKNKLHVIFKHLTLLITKLFPLLLLNLNICLDNVIELL